jgi:hypothetical protein
MLFYLFFIHQNRNVQPPVFDLQNITTHLPNFRSNNTEERNQASAQWWRTFEAMQLLLRKGATALNKEEEEKYIISVTNEEVFNGIFSFVLLSTLGPPSFLSPKRVEFRGYVQFLWTRET